MWLSRLATACGRVPADATTRRNRRTEDAGRAGAKAREYATGDERRPGQIPMNQIEMQVAKENRDVQGAPFYTLGPV
jgi:hypothetical protein